MFCPKCGKEVPGGAAFCPGCGAVPSAGQPAKNRWMPTVAGVLDIIDGCVNLIVIAGLIVAIANVSDEPDTLAVLVPITIVFAVKVTLSLAGGLCALRRSNWVMALIGAIATLLPFSLLGVAALVLTALSRDQFTKGRAPD